MLPSLALVLGAFFVGPGLAIVLLLLERRRRKARRRAAFDRKMLRAPGNSLREQIDEAKHDSAWSLMSLSALPVIVLCIYLAQTRSVVSVSGLWPVYLLATVVLVVYEASKILGKSKRLEILRVGYDAEVAAGQELDQLMLEGARVFHDFPCDGFNIDHVVVSKQGLFAIETKGVSKPADIQGRPGSTVSYDGVRLKFPSWTTSAPVEQAQRQARWLAEWCGSAVGESVSVRGVVALPGWYVERVGQGVVDVRSGRELRFLLGKQRQEPLTPQLVKRVAHQVEQRCRDVEPTVRRAERK